jgi:hypothetical protein
MHPALDQSRRDLTQSWAVARIRVSASPGEAERLRFAESRSIERACHGEADQEEGSADLSPAERICQEWRTLDLQAKQESEAPQGNLWSSWREKIEHRTEFGQRRLMALAPKGANLRKGVNKKGARIVPLFILDRLRRFVASNR